MEHTELHQQKITILSRLIKESTLTLEEALLLLRKEETESSIISTPSFRPGITTISPQAYFGSGTIPLSGTVNTVSFPTGTGTFNTTTTYFNPDTPQTLTADLNT